MSKENSVIRVFDLIPKTESELVIILISSIDNIKPSSIPTSLVSFECLHRKYAWFHSLHV